MANRKPLVNNAGALTEIPAGDAIQLASGGIRFSDNSVQTTAATGGGGGNSTTVDVDFGSSFTDKAQVVVTGLSWVTTSSEITCQILCPTTSDPDEMYMLNIKPVVSSLVDSTGFTLTLYSEQEAKGIYKVMCVGV